MRAQAEALAREGWSLREICRRVGTNHHNVRPIIAELGAKGEVPANCPCGKPRGRGHGGGDCALASSKAGKTRRKPGPVTGTSGYDRATVREIERRARKGESGRRIADEMGLSLIAVQKRIRRWAAVHADEIKPCKCGRPARHPGGCIKNSPTLLSTDRIERIQRWAREGVSAAEMGRRSRKLRSTSGIHTILKYAVPVWEDMASEGMFCGRGVRRSHRGLCIATWGSGGRVRGPWPIPVAMQKRIANLLLLGDSMNSIRLNAEASWKQVFRVFRAMSAEERHQRLCKVRRRLADDDGRLHGRDLYERVQRLVPRGLEHSLRDEVVAELCLAVLRGDVTVDKIRTKVWTFVGKAFNTWASSFQRSADEALGDDDDRTLGDLFGDDTMVHQMEELSIGASTMRLALPSPAKPDRSRQEMLALDVLNLDATATIDRAKSAWRQLAKQSHPDTNANDPTAARRFQAIQAAWDILRKADDARAMATA